MSKLPRSGRAADRAPPAFQFYPDDFLNDDKVAGMSLQEIGAYVVLLCHAWTNRGIPSDQDRLSRILGVSRPALAKLWPALKPCWQAADDGRLVNPRMERERELQAAYREQQADSGRRGAQKRWHGDPMRSPSAPDGEPIVSPMANGMANDSSASSSTSASTDSLRSSAVPRAPARSQPGRRSVPSSPGDPGSPTRAFTDGWCARFQAAKGAPYGFDGAKDGRHAAAILALAGLRKEPESAPEEAAAAVATALERADRLLASTDPWFIDKGIDLGTLHSQWNRLASAGRGARDVRVGQAQPSPHEAFKTTGRVDL